MLRAENALMGAGGCLNAISHQTCYSVKKAHLNFTFSSPGIGPASFQSSTEKDTVDYFAPAPRPVNLSTLLPGFMGEPTPLFLGVAGEGGQQRGEEVGVGRRGRVWRALRGSWRRSRRRDEEPDGERGRGERQRCRHFFDKKKELTMVKLCRREGGEAGGTEFYLLICR